MESGRWERGRGRGRARGWGRGWGRGHARQWRGDTNNRENKNYSDGPPRGLSGKQIGLWYRDRGRGRRDPDRMAKERTVAHIEEKQLELLESRLGMLEGLSSNDKNRKTGIL